MRNHRETKNRTVMTLGDSSSDESKEGQNKQKNVKGVNFRPPVYKQRYQFCIDLINNQKKNINTVLDVGCAGCSFIMGARFKCERIKRLIGVDIDSALLADFCVGNLIHLHSGQERYFLDKRQKSLNVQLYAGGIDEFDTRLSNIDVVVAIELIEHLYPETLAKVPATIFGKIRPKLAIFTTPNCEFNPFFDLAPGQFRHDDHKFEWNRIEFGNWCKENVKNYPEYNVHFDGVGKLDSTNEIDETPDLIGYCSQIAVFECNNYSDLEESKSENFDQNEQPYELLLNHTYPFDPNGDRFDRIRNTVHSICYEMSENCEHQFEKVKCRKKGESLAIPLDLVYDKLPDMLKVFAKNKWEAASIASTGNWSCCPSLNSENGGFSRFNEPDPPGFMLMPISCDEYSNSDVDSEDISEINDVFSTRSVGNNAE